MNVFSEAQTLHPKEQLAFIQGKLPRAIFDAGFEMFTPQQSTPTHKNRMLIGIAPYSSGDFELLDSLAQAVRKVQLVNLRIEVFDVSACRTMSDFELYVPGLGNVYQTPVVGIWTNNVPIKRSWGYRAKHIISEYCGLPGNEQTNLE